jgi:hypothetical protein
MISLSSQSRILRTLALVVLTVGGLIAGYPLENYLERHRDAVPSEWTDEDLSVNGGRLRGFAFGAEGLLADWYWMRSLQYIGNKLNSAETEVNIDDLRPLDPRLLYPYLDTATDLDPGFIPAYTYGAVVLPAIDPELAIKLTKKGIANNPRAWRLHQYLGYIFWRLERYEEASDVYAEGAKVPGAPPFMQLMVGAMKTEGGSADTARQIYLQMANDDSDSQTQYYARYRLMQLDSLEERDVIRAALKNFQEKYHRCPWSWNELHPFLVTQKLPRGRSLRIDAQGRVVDPSDTPYLIREAECDVSLNYLETKVPTR